MAIVNHDAANVAQVSLFHLVVGGLVAGVPGGFVVDEDLDVMFAGGGAARAPSPGAAGAPASSSTATVSKTAGAI